MKLALERLGGEDATLNMGLVVITALVLQNLVLVAALARLASPDVVVVGRALFKVAILLVTEVIR